MKDKINMLDNLKKTAKEVVEMQQQTPYKAPTPKAQRLSPAPIFEFSFKGLLSAISEKPISIAPECIRITENTPIPDETVLIKMGGQVIASSGNILGYSGAMKVGKSAITAVTIAGCLPASGIINDPLPGIELTPNEALKAVVHIDTEQSVKKHKNNVCSILRRAGFRQSPAHYHSYNIRNLEFATYKQTLLTICEQANRENGGIQLIVIDGIADFITDVNSTQESQAIIKFFMDMSTHYNTVVLVIIHTNPNGEKERGHLGSDLGRKCESLLSIKKDKGVSYIEAKECRNAEATQLPVIRFAYDAEKGYHVATTGTESADGNKADKRQNQLRNLAQEVFAGAMPYSDKNCQEMLMKHQGKGIATVKTQLSEMRLYDILIKAEKGGGWILNKEMQ